MNNYNNYKLIKEEYLEEIKSEMVLLNHTKSGARIVLIKNEDKNKTFTIGFRTPPTDDTGVPHIMEHSTLCGSKKFPAKDPFVELLKSSLNTFLNAMTFSDKTIYPVASCNDKDFANLMEVYLDAVFYPNVYIHEEIFKQEGWHYELNDIDSPIILNGVVYNEMKGAFSSVDEVVLRATLRGLFPDTTYGCESGGDPAAIPNLTYENFKNFHSKLYSPANSYIILYGDINYEERLEFLDKEYLSKFDVIDVDSHIDYQKPFDKPLVKEIEYNVGVDGETLNKTNYIYGTVVGDYKDDLLCAAFKALDYVLFSAPGAPVRQALIDSGFCKDVDSMYDEGLLQPIFALEAKDAQEDKLEEFKQIIFDTLKEQVKKGIDKKALKSVINAYAFKIKEGDTGRLPKGLSITIDLLGGWLYDENNPFSKLHYNETIDQLKKAIDTSYFEDVVEKYLINNNHACFVIAKPSKTLGNSQDEALKEKLENYKKTLSKEELIKLIEDTKALKEYQATPSTKEEIDSIPVLKREDINEKCGKLYNTIDSLEDIKVIKHEIETNGIGYLNLVFNAENINKEDINYLSLVTNLLGLIDTNNYKYQELNQEIDMNSGGIGITSNCITTKDGYMPTLTVVSKYLYGQEEFVCSIIEEILMHSKFTDLSRIKQLIMEDSQNLENKLMSSGHIASANRALSYISSTYYFRDQNSGIGYYEFIKHLENNFDQEIDTCLNKCIDVLQRIVRKENLIISYTGLEDGYKQYLTKTINNLYISPIDKRSIEFAKEIKNEGFKTPGRVNYCGRVGTFDPKKYTGAILVFENALRYDYLWIKVRVQGGAYGVTSELIPNGFGIFTSYRDPNMKETYKVYEETINYLENFDCDEATLTKYVISAIGSLDTPNSPRAEGEKSFHAYMRGVTEEQMQKTRDEVLNVTIEDIRNLKDLYKDILDQNAICVIGNENKIEENKDLFKETKNLLIK